VEKCSPSCLLHPLPYSLLYHLRSLTSLKTLILYSPYSTLQSTTPSLFTLPIVNAVPPAPLSLTCNGSSGILSQTGYNPQVYEPTSTSNQDQWQRVLGHQQVHQCPMVLQLIPIQDPMGRLLRGAWHLGECWWHQLQQGTPPATRRWQQFWPGRGFL